MMKRVEKRILTGVIVTGSNQGVITVGDVLMLIGQILLDGGDVV